LSTHLRLGQPKDNQTKLMVTHITKITRGNYNRTCFVSLSMSILPGSNDCVYVKICPSMYLIIIQFLPYTGTLAVLIEVLRGVPPCKFRGGNLN
jgi:hypothetical protein